MARPNILAPDGTLRSDLWIDQPNAPDMIAAKLERGEITASEADRLNKIWADGYAIFDSGLPRSFFASAVAEGRRAWKERPNDLLAASNLFNHGKPMALAHFPAGFQPKPGCRTLDSHSHNPYFADLMALPVLHRFIDLLLDEKCLATQSLYFPYGSEQALHRDPWFVVTTPVSTLFAAWIALEDITLASGPLLFVPKSHRMPYKPLNTGDIVFHDPRATAAAREAHLKDMHAQMAERGMAPKPFLAKCGEILVWHGSLVHGGSPTATPPPSRESLVIHFDATRNCTSTARAVRVHDTMIGTFRTEQILARDGNLWFANPVAGHNLLEPVAAG